MSASSSSSSDFATVTDKKVNRKNTEWTASMEPANCVLLFGCDWNWYEESDSPMKLVHAFDGSQADSQHIANWIKNNPQRWHHLYIPAERTIVDSDTGERQAPLAYREAVLKSESLPDSIRDYIRQQYVTVGRGHVHKH